MSLILLLTYASSSVIAVNSVVTSIDDWATANLSQEVEESLAQEVQQEEQSQKVTRVSSRDLKFSEKTPETRNGDVYWTFDGNQDKQKEKLIKTIFGMTVSGIIIVTLYQLFANK